MKILPYLALLTKATSALSFDADVMESEAKYVALSNGSLSSPDILDSVFFFSSFLNLFGKKGQKLASDCKFDGFDRDSELDSDCEFENVHRKPSDDSEDCSDSDSDSELEYGYYQLDSSMKRRFTAMRKSEVGPKLKSIFHKYSNQPMDPIKQMVRYIGLDEEESEKITKTWNAFYSVLSPIKHHLRLHIQLQMLNRKAKSPQLKAMLAKSNGSNSTTKTIPPFPAAGYRFIAARLKKLESEMKRGKNDSTPTTNDTKSMLFDDAMESIINSSFCAQVSWMAIMGAFVLVLAFP